MDKKTAFNEALSELVSFATANGNKITMGEVKSHFDGLIDDDSQYRFIYDYLTVNKIEVTGFTPSDENFFGGGDDSASISAQLSKISSMNPKRNWISLKCIWRISKNILP